MLMMLVLVLLFSTAVASSATRQAPPSPVSVFTFNQFVWIIVGGVFAVCLVVGFSIPCCLCVRQDDERWRNTVVILYALSWFFPGLDVGSIALSWHSHRKNTPEWRTCSPVCSSVLGLFEFILVVVCFPLAAVLDCVLLPNFFVTDFSSSGVPFFLLLLAIPGYFGALLFFGLPRVLTMYNATSTKRRDRALEIVLSAAVATTPIDMDHACNNCQSPTTTKSCGSCGSNNKCDTCDVFVVGQFCSSCGASLIPALQPNPYAQQAMVDQTPAIPSSKPALPPKKTTTSMASPPLPPKKERRNGILSIFSFPPDSMPLWILSVVLLALSLIVLALCAAQVSVAGAVCPSLQSYSNTYRVNSGGQWYASVCIGVFTGVVGLLAGGFGLMWLLSTFSLHRIIKFVFLSVLCFIALFAFILAIMCSVMASQLMAPQSFLAGQSVSQSFINACNFGQGQICIAQYVIMLIPSAVFAFALTGIAVFLAILTTRELQLFCFK